MSAVAISWVERVLGRSQHDIPLDEPLAALADERILITGANGSIGSALISCFVDSGINVIATDIRDLDVRRRKSGVSYWVVAGETWLPSVVFHLAGAKHAPEGEADPWAVCETNTVGTRNIIERFPSARVVLASTCKAADPETAYGASKLIAERMVLNVGGSVARFYNVVESYGNVFETWEALPEDAPLPVTPCSRFFMSISEAVALLLHAAVLPTGRYAVDPGKARPLSMVATDLYPRRAREDISARRGDRLREPLHAASETIEVVGARPLMRIRSPHDPERAQ